MESKQCVLRTRDIPTTRAIFLLCIGFFLGLSLNEQAGRKEVADKDISTFRPQ